MPVPVPPDAHAVYRRYLSAVILNSLAHADVAGLHPTDLYALNVLELNGMMTAGELAEQTGLTTGATTRLVDRLVHGGYVRRTIDTADRRRIIIEAIPDPDFASADTFAPARRRVAEVFARYDADQIEILLDYFRHATAALQAATNETRRSARNRD